MFNHIYSVCVFENYCILFANEFAYVFSVWPAVELLLTLTSFCAAAATSVLELLLLLLLLLLVSFCCAKVDKLKDNVEVWHCIATMVVVVALRYLLNCVCTHGAGIEFAFRQQYLQVVAHTPHWPRAILH